MLVSLSVALIGCNHHPPMVSGSVSKPSSPGAVPVSTTWQASSDGKRVLVVWNKPNPEGKSLAEYYARKRGVPSENIIEVRIDAGDDTNSGALANGFYPMVRKRISESKTPIDFIVLCKGVPFRYYDGGNGISFDAHVSTMDIDPAKISGPQGNRSIQLANPYFQRDESFSSKKFGFYLVTRLDGYTYEDARGLVDNAMKAKGDKGPFFLDSVPTIGQDGYGQMNQSMVEAGEVLRKKGIDVTVDRSLDFIRPADPLMGYCSWGSNDKSFSQTSYVSIRFKPGALAETFVSTSARSMKPVTSGQSVITDLIKNGVTGVKGYCLEPYTVALARPHILFDRYTSGYNLAESFYMASPVIRWRDIVFGDPLCRPYKK